MNRRPFVAAALFVIPFLVYLEDFHYAGSGDTQPAELLPVAVLQDGNFDFRRFFRPGEPLPYAFQERGGKVISIYPILPGLLNVPTYAAAAAFGIDIEAERIRLSMISSALISALSVFFLFLALDRLVARRSTAVLLAVTYAFGTCAWSVASRGMFQHGPSLLMQSLALWMLARGDSRSVAGGGFFLGLAVVGRPTNLLLAIPLAVAVYRKHRESFAAFCVLGGIPFALRSIYARAYWGSALSLAQADPFPAVSHFGGNPFRGLAGLLVSPSRGLFVYSPIFLFVGLAVGPAVRLRREKPIYLALLVGALAILLATSSWTIWWGGHSFGYRLLIEMLPALTVLLALAWDEAIAGRRVRTAAFVFFLCGSVFLQAFGARYQPTGFNQKLDQDPGALWSLRESDVARAIRQCFRIA